MFCVKCGKELNNEAVVCVNCGCLVDKKYDKNQVQSKDENYCQKRINFITILSYVIWNILSILVWDLTELYEKGSFWILFVDLVFIAGMITALIFVCKESVKTWLIKYVHVFILIIYALYNLSITLIYYFI